MNVSRSSSTLTMEITAQLVMSIRDKTGVSMMACKKALLEADGNEEKAIEILRKRGEMKSAEKSDRATKEGAVAIAMKNGKACIASLRCETDFVSRNADFQKLAQAVAKAYLEKGSSAQASNEAMVQEAVNKLGENIQLGEFFVIEAPVIGGYVHTNFKIGTLVGLEKGTVEQARDVAMHAAAMNPKVKYPEDVSGEVIAKEKEIWSAQLAQEKKPAHILENILKGKEKKFREENALSSQVFVKDNTKTVGQYLGDAKIVQYVRLSI